MLDKECTFNSAFCGLVVLLNFYFFKGVEKHSLARAIAGMCLVYPGVFQYRCRGVAAAPKRALTMAPLSIPARARVGLGKTNLL